MEITIVKIEDIQSYEYNAKLHPEWQIEQIMRSILEFGFNDPIAIDEKNTIIEGHGRYEALKRLGHKEVEVIKLEHLSEEKKNAYIITHNKITLNTGVDLEILDYEVNKLKSLDFDLELLGFTEIELDDLQLKKEMFLEKGVEENLTEVYEEPKHEYLVCPHCQHRDTKAHFKTTKE